VLLCVLCGDTFRSVTVFEFRAKHPARKKKDVTIVRLNTALPVLKEEVSIVPM
jgi:hypothetical protein